jgi:hypothetical protein
MHRIPNSKPRQNNFNKVRDAYPTFGVKLIHREFRDGFLPFAAPSTGAFEWISPTGAMQGCVALTTGLGSPFRQPRSKARSAGFKRHPGVFSFGYFSLDKQRKVTRPPVREPALKYPSRSREKLTTLPEASIFQSRHEPERRRFMRNESGGALLGFVD